MVDEHYYRAPQWFWDNLHRYDAYDRTGPKVYVGEYAAHEKDRRNTLRTALAEAAGCISFERNGDMVHLASYAPLLARRGHTQWTPDLIYFTATDVYPSINYEVQRLFGENGGSHLLEAKIDGVMPAEHLAASVVRDEASGEVILKVVNAEASSRTMMLTLSPAAAAGYAVKVTTLTGASADVANEDGAPPAAQVTVSEFHTSGTATRVVPPHSLTVLRFK